MANLNYPPSRVEAYTPTDSKSLPFVTTAIYIGDGTAKDVQITDVYGNVVVIAAITPGVWFPIRATVIWSSNTTATKLLIGSSV